MGIIAKIKLRGKARKHRMTFGEYCLLYKHNAISNHEEQTKQPKPMKLCGRWMPSSLNSVAIGQIVEVLNLKDDIKVLTTLYNVTTGELQDERAEIVIGAINWTAEQLKSIGYMFSALERDLTAEEIMAGAENMKGDIFTTIDWYARRMGYQHHDDVLKVSWITIWRCCKDDRESGEYRQRLQQIHNQQNKIQ